METTVANQNGKKAEGTPLPSVALEGAATASEKAAVSQVKPAWETRLEAARNGDKTLILSQQLTDSLLSIGLIQQGVWIVPRWAQRGTAVSGKGLATTHTAKIVYLPLNGARGAMIQALALAVGERASQPPTKTEVSQEAKLTDDKEVAYLLKKAAEVCQAAEQEAKSQNQAAPASQAPQSQTKTITFGAGKPVSPDRLFEAYMRLSESDKEAFANRVAAERKEVNKPAATPATSKP